MKAEYTGYIFERKGDRDPVKYHMTAEDLPGNMVKFEYISPAGEKGSYAFPVKPAPGYAVKINRSSIGTDSGTAESLVKFFRDGAYGKVFFGKAVSHMILQNPSKGRYAV